MDINKKIQEVLEEKVNPLLSAHFGGAILASFDNKIAKVKMTGACAACPSAKFTVESIVKKIVMENCKGVEDVILDTSASDELLSMATKIMHKE